jgi:dipicolinate synthase subunit B
MKILFAMCGSFCTHKHALEQLKQLAPNNTVVTAVSEVCQRTDTRFGRAEEILARIEGLSGSPVIRTLQDAEPVGPVHRPDLMIIAPCTGNTTAKLCHGISDTPVTLAAKAHRRSGKPLLLAFASNDGLSGNFENIARLYGQKNLYFVPLCQDDPINKPYSLVCDFARIPEAARAAVEGRQLLPLFS